MLHHRNLIPAAILIPILLSSHVPGDRIRFAPSEGSTATKTFENKAEFTLQSMKILMNGQEPPAKPEMEMTITSTQKVVVTDDYVANREGAPKKLRRNFEELGNTVSMSMKMQMMGNSQNQDKNTTGESELQGKKVLFTWDDDKGEYTKAFEPAAEKENLLKDLEEDMDLRELLPKEEVKEGAEWEIDVTKFASILAPGGNLSIVPKDSEEGAADMEMPGMSNVSDWLRGAMEGSATGKFKGLQEVGGAKMGVIEIVAKISVSKDMTEMIEAMMKKSKQPVPMEVDHMDVDFKYEAKGELVWDLAAGRAHSFSLSGPSHVNMDMAMKIEAQGTNMNIDYGMELSGNTTLSLEVK